jgi:predicted PurR-regulated permease PerM
MQALDDLDTGRVGLAAFGLFLALVVGFVVYSFLGVFVLGVFLYYATRPFHRRFDAYLPGSVAAALSLFMLAVPVVVLVGYTAAVGYGELASLVDMVGVDALDGVVPAANVTAAVDDPGSLISGRDPGRLADVARAALGYLGLVFSSVLDVVVAFTLAFYLLRDGGRLRGLLEEYLDKQGSAVDADRLDDYFDAIDADLETVFFGNILNALLIAVIGAVAYSALNLFAPAGLAVPYPVLVGILAGAASLVPVVGMKIVYVPVVAYLAGLAFTGGGGWNFVAAFAVVSVVVVDTIPDLALRPWVSGGDLHLGTVMFAYIFGPLVFGWYGLFLGPLVLVLTVHFYDIVLDLGGESGDDGQSAAGEPAASGDEGGNGADDPEPAAAGDPSPEPDGGNPGKG